MQNNIGNINIAVLVGRFFFLSTDLVCKILCVFTRVLAK